MSTYREPSELDPTVEAAAAEWLVKQDRGFTPQEQDEFLQWLAAAPAHRASFQRHRAMWSDFNALAHWRPEHSAEPNPDLLARPRRRRLLRWALPAALGLATILTLAFLWPALVPHAGRESATFETAVYRQETLPDGSIVDLNRGAHVVVQFTPAERRVLLVQGEAQFTVAKNPARPFVVRAGGVDVRAVGTAFNVKLAGANLEVLVTEGRVHVSQHTAARQAPDATPTLTSTSAGAAASHSPDSTSPSALATAGLPLLAELSAGHRTIIAIAPAAVVQPPPVLTPSPAEIEQLLEWKPSLLEFDSTPLAEVVETFNRRAAARLVIADAELRTLPIVASIRSDNVAGFVRLLEVSMNIRAEARATGEIALYRVK